MKKTTVVIAIALILSALYLGSAFLGYETLALKLRSAILPFVIYLYISKVKFKSRFFLAFLIVFGASELMGLWIDKIPNNYMFFIGNSLYIIGYLFLITEIISIMSKTITFKELLKKYPIYILVLLVTGGFLLQRLTSITKPESSHAEFLVSTIFSVTILVLLALSFINYIHNDTKKSLFIFIASLCLVFSEVIQISYFYLFTEQKTVLSIIYSILLFIAFYFYIRQAFIEFSVSRSLKPSN